jgi:hypothetical protein
VPDGKTLEERDWARFSAPTPPNSIWGALEGASGDALTPLRLNESWQQKRVLLVILPLVNGQSIGRVSKLKEFILKDMYVLRFWDVN